MNDTTTVQLPEGVQRVPESWNGQLTLQELDIASRQLQHDVGLALAERGNPHRYKAMALCAWLLHKRTDPRAKLQPYLDCEAPQISYVLRDDEADDEPAGDVDPGDVEAPEYDENPTDSAPA